MLVKFQFFKGMASVLSLYLTKFQTDAPTMLFLPKFKESSTMSKNIALKMQERSPLKYILVSLTQKFILVSLSSLTPKIW